MLRNANILFHGAVNLIHEIKFSLKVVTMDGGFKCVKT